MRTTIKRNPVCSILLAVFVSIASIFPPGSAAQTERRIRPELIVQTGHSSRVTAVAYSPDGKRIATGSYDSTIRLWNAVAGTEIRSLAGHTDMVLTVAFSPDGKLLASGGQGDTIKVWDAETGSQVNSFQTQTRTVYSIAFNPEGKLLASGSFDGTVKLWDPATGTEVRYLGAHASVSFSSAVRSVSFSPDGKTLASAGDDSTVRLWDTATGSQIRILKGHASSVNSVAFSPDGKKLASGSSDSTIMLWDTATGISFRTLRGHAGGIDSIAFSPEGTKLASGGGDGTVGIWDMTTWQRRHSLLGHTASVSSVAFPSDGKTLASAGGDRTIMIWDAGTGARVRVVQGQTSLVHSVAFSTDGAKIASGNQDNTVKLWDTAVKTQLDSLRGHTYPAYGLAFSPDGRTLASGSLDGKIKIWDAETGTELRTLAGHTSSVFSIAFSPDGRKLVSGSGDKTVKIWDAETWTNLKTLIGHASAVSAVAVSPDGKMIASGSWDKTVSFWDAESGVKFWTFNAHTSYLTAVAFSPDGKTLASGSRDRTVKLSGTETGTNMHTFKRRSASVNSVAFSPDGTTLVAASGQTVELWDVATGTQVHALEGHRDLVVSGAFSPDGKTLISGSYDGTVKIWDPTAGRLLASLIAVDGSDWVVTTPDGRFETNKSLDRIEGLHWLLPDQPLKPAPLDLFVRQYYEPNLLARILKCSRENTCGTEFRPLPLITEINCVQPLVSGLKVVKVNPDGTVDVEVTAASVRDSLRVVPEYEQRELVSGVYDLRLFRDGQLIGSSSPKERLGQYFSKASSLVEEGRKKSVLVNTPEDAEWRKANDLSTVPGVRNDGKGEFTYTFRNVAIPQDGSKAVELTAYGFNEDRVRSNVVTLNYTLPKAIASKPARQGRAYLVTIGVNSSENQQFNLRYAANDARKMREVLGARLRAEKERYAEIVEVPLVSDFAAEGRPAENNARKALVRSVFALLAGRPLKQVSTELARESPELAAALSKIPGVNRIRAVAPEDTLIVTFSGHGYADQSGIFYLLPYDIGEKTNLKTPESLRRTISSDELSLWMRDITAREMIFVIDACHSSAAVQGDGFKPGPMGSRGLGQLAYDKDMKILSATQADNVALELGSLQQGLLSYALLQDGINGKLADADKDGKLDAAEWLRYAEKRVPELYQEVKEGRRGVIVDGQQVKARDLIDLDGSQPKTSLNLQQPTLFDFRRRKRDGELFLMR